MLVRTLVALAAGLLLSLAFEPVAVAYVVPLALAGFALTTRGLRARSGWVPGLAFGAGFYFVHIWWMQVSIATEAWIALATRRAFYGVLGSVAAVLHRLRAWPAWLACAWTAMELVRRAGRSAGCRGAGSSSPPSTPRWHRCWPTSARTASAFVLGGDRLPAGGAGGGARAAGRGGGAGARGRRGGGARPVPYETDDTGETTVALVQGNVPGRGNDVLVDVAGPHPQPRRRHRRPRAPRRGR